MAGNSVDSNAACGSGERDGADARIPVGIKRCPLNGDVCEWDFHRFPEPCRDGARVAVDFDGLNGHRCGSCCWVLGGILRPVHEVGQLWIVDQIENTDLLPGEFHTIRAHTSASNSLATEALLNQGEVVHGNNPAEPTATRIGPLLDGASERSLVGCGVVESCHDLDVAVALQREDEVLCPEPGVAATIDEARLKVRTDALHDVCQFGLVTRIGQVVQSHNGILPNCSPDATGAPRSGPKAHQIWHGCAVTQPAPSTQGLLNTRRSIVLGIVGLAVIVVIFWKVIPQIGSYSQAWASLEGMGYGAMALVVVTVIVYLAAYGLPFKAATPGLRYWPSQQVNQAAFAISNGVPGGGALGLAVQFGMLATRNITPTAATAAITAVGLWSTFVTLGLPIFGVAAIGLSGEGTGSYLGTAVLGIVILVAAVVAFVLVMRSPRLATAIGTLGNRCCHGLGRWIKPLRQVDVLGPVERFRADMADLLAHRWLAITGAQVAVSLTQFLILYVTVRGIEGWGNDGTSIFVVFAAFAIAQLGLMLPITPGGLGTVDAIMIAIMTQFGVAPGDATAADLVWRACSYIPQIIIGILALVLWYRTAHRRLAGGPTPAPN